MPRIYRPLSEETKRKIALAHIGTHPKRQPCSEETKRKISVSLTIPLEKRFWENVEISNSTNCWLWTGYRDRRGYGVIIKKKKAIKAHRLSFLINNGYIDDNLLVLHKCNNPACVNPAHLYQGTPQDNSNDRVNSDRHPKGERNFSAKLTEKQVIEIIKLLKTGKTHKAISLLYNVTKSAIGSINTGRSWRYLPR